MPGLREIQLRLRSVISTKQITYAMKLVSAAKLKKAQDAVTRGRAYTDALNGLISQLSSELEGSETVHPLMAARAEVKNIRLLVVGGARGLCGGFNTNLNRRADLALKELATQYPGANITSVVLGKKPAEYYRRVERSYVEAYENLPEDAIKWPVDEVCRKVELEFLAGDLDAVFVVYTRFKSALTMTPVVEQLLPLKPDALAPSAAKTPSSAAAPGMTPAPGMTLFEPSADAVFGAVLPRVLRSKLRQACFDSKASETGARMTAMEAATKNAGDLIRKLTLTANKLRQSGITAQLLDIVGGAEAAKS